METLYFFALILDCFPRIESTANLNHKKIIVYDCTNAPFLLNTPGPLPVKPQNSFRPYTILQGSRIKAKSVFFS